MMASAASDPHLLELQIDQPDCLERETGIVGIVNEPIKLDFALTVWNLALVQRAHFTFSPRFSNTGRFTSNFEHP